MFVYFPCSLWLPRQENPIVTLRSKMARRSPSWKLERISGKRLRDVGCTHRMCIIVDQNEARIRLSKIGRVYLGMEVWYNKRYSGLGIKSSLLVLKNHWLKLESISRLWCELSFDASLYHHIYQIHGVWYLGFQLCLWHNWYWDESSLITRRCFGSHFCFNIT